MKNFVKSIVLALVLMCSTSAMAQREGLSEAGVNFGYMAGAKDMSNFGIGVKYGYMLSDNLRLEANGMYYFTGAKADKSYFSEPKHYDINSHYGSGKDTNWFDVNVNAHYLFNVADQVSIYPIFGFTTMFGKTAFKLADKGFNTIDDLKEVVETNAEFYKDVVTKDKDKKEILKDSYSDKHFRFGINLGFGGQYEITEDFAVTLEAKYKLIKDFGNFNIALGCVVLF